MNTVVYTNLPQEWLPHRAQELLGTTSAGLR